jgi:fucose permease
MIVALGVVTGLGAGAIDGGINTYVASHYGERLMHWLHASWGVGITLGPLIMTAGLARFHDWRWGYVVVGSAQLALAGFFALTLSQWRQPVRQPAPDSEPRLTDFRTPYRDTLRQFRVWLSLLLFFLFAGAEATAGMWTYTLLTESRGVEPRLAGILTGAYWATFTLGRIVAGACAGRLPAKALIRLGLAGALAGAMLLWWNPGPIPSLMGVVMLGFCIAPIFPGLVSNTSQRVGRRDAANTIGMQIGAAGLGAALLPGLAGILAQRFTMESIPAFLVLLLILLIALNAATATPREEAP